MSDKFEREIEEIVGKEGDDFLTGPDVPRPPRRRRRGPDSPQGPSWLARLLARFSSLNRSQVMLGSIALMLIFVLLGQFLPGFGTVLILGAVVLFAVSYGASFIGRPLRGGTPKFSSGGPEKRWRGEKIVPMRRPPITEQIARWFRRKPQR